MKIANGVEMLEISGQVMGQTKIICPTLIFDDSTVILVDAGFLGQLSIISKEIEKIGISFDSLKMIILTHHDIDHIGSLQKILGELPNVKVLAHEEEKPYVNGDKLPLKLIQFEKNYDSLSDEMKMMYKNLKAGFGSSIAQVDETLIDGEELSYLGGIKVIHTPGHTHGHICLYLKQSKTLIAGDLLSVTDGMLHKASPQMNFDTNLSDKSLKKLKEYDIETVICYHGGAYKDKANERIAELVMG